MEHLNRRILKGLTYAIAAAAVMAGPAAHGADERLERLSPENKALAQRMLRALRAGTRSTGTRWPP